MRTFTFDSDVIIHFNVQYPRDVFPSLWENLEELIQRKLICICQSVQIELERGNDQLIEWVSSLGGFVCHATGDELILASVISNLYPGWVRETTNAADPFIIAHAELNSHVIVSDERRTNSNVSHQNQKLPNVADARGTESISLIPFVREMQWSF